MPVPASLGQLYFALTVNESSFAGMACAWSLSRFPERFEVEVWEALPETGGVASTCAIDGGARSTFCSGAACGTWDMAMDVYLRACCWARSASALQCLLAAVSMAGLGAIPSNSLNRRRAGPAGEEINDQVQGGAPSYRNNLLFFKVWRAVAGVL